MTIFSKPSLFYLKVFKYPYKKFKAQKNVDVDTVHEFIWCIDKNGVGYQEQIICETI